MLFAAVFVFPVNSQSSEDGILLNRIDILGKGPFGGGQIDESDPVAAEGCLWWCIEMPAQECDLTNSRQDSPIRMFSPQDCHTCCIGIVANGRQLRPPCQRPSGSPIGSLLLSAHICVARGETQSNKADDPRAPVGGFFALGNTMTCRGLRDSG